MAIATAADLIDINGNLLTIAEFLAQYQEDLDEAAAGRRFKKFVHTRLDQMGVPADPNPNRTAETGCRIGERLNWIQGRWDRVDRAAAVLRGEHKDAYNTLMAELEKP